MCIVCADMSGQFRRTDFVPEDLAIDRGLSARQRAAGDSPLAFLDADDRGGTGPNGKLSLTPTEAGSQITRTNSTWGTGIGQSTTVTYAYRADAPTAMPAGTSGFSSFTQIQIEATELMLLAWADVAGITFQRQGAGTSGPGAYSNNATMLFGNYSAGQGGAAAFAYLPNGDRSAGALGGDVWVNSTLSYNATPAYLGYGYQVLLHEIGHAIGLSHPAAYNAGEGVTITYDAHATYYEDSRQYTVMSYFSETNTGGQFLGRYASAPLLDDIAAAQRLYGANLTTRTGDTVYGFNSTADRIWYDATQGGGAQAVVFAVWDADGIDTLDFSGYSQNGVIDLRQGHFSSVGGMSGNVSIAMGATIERAVGGGGNDTIIGNGADNRITGGLGSDTIEGGAGSDTAVFAGTQASYTITPGTEIVDGVAYRILTVTASGGGGTDVLRNVEFLAFSDGTIAAPTAAAGVLVEGDLTANTIAGTAFADWIHGAAGADTLTGADGNDRLNGGSGNDTLDGGNGSDTADYTGAGGGVTVDLGAGTATGGAGSDTLTSIENVRGSAHADTLTGDGTANTLNGGGGVDTLNGGGGNDTLIAGAGSLVGAQDVIKPSSTNNFSRALAVNIDANFDLMDDPGVLNATTTPHAVIQATSNGGGKEYYAFTVAAGAACTFDIASVTGGLDTVVRLFDSAGNELAVNDDDGTSQNSLLNYTFATGGTYYVEVGGYVSGSGASVVSGPPPAGSTYVLNVSIPGHAVVPIVDTGSTLNGGSGDDILQGGTSPDTLNGGDGSDTAVFAGNRSAWTITDNGGGNFTISNGSQTDTLTNVEFAQFADQTVSLGGAPVGPTPGDDSLEGTAGDDVIDGLAGNDDIDGLAGNDVLTGGLGSDTLTGGTGFDRFVYNSAAESTNDANRDLITDFTSAQDVLDFSAAGSDRITIQRSGADSIVYFGSAPGDVYQGQVRLNGVAVQGYDLLVGNPDLTILGDDAVNNLTGHLGADIIRGGGGNDILNGAAGADVLTGGDGNDRFDISNASHSGIGAHDVITDFTTGSDRLNLGGLVTAGYTSISLTRVGGSTFVYFALPGQAPAGVVEAVGLVNGADLALAGQVLNLTFTGSNATDVMTGADGADTLNGGGGDDTLNGGLGNDTVNGGAGNDMLIGAGGTDTLNGGSGDDTLQGGAGADFLRGLDGIDAADYANSNGAVTVNLLTGTGAGAHAQGDTFEAVENVIGSAFNDVLNGDNGVNGLNGGDGDDLLSGAGGDDVLNGGAGIDTVNGGSGLDRLFGGDGNDILNGGAGDDILEGGAGADLLRGLEGFDTASYAGSNAAVTVDLGAGTGLGGHAEGDTYDLIAAVIGSAFNDVITGDAGANVLDGAGGTDTLNGADGNDTLNGGGADDVLNGGLGVDVLNGGSGNDTMNGDDGNDRLNGGAGDDILVGGAGADRLRGLTGVDIATYAASAAAVTVNLTTGTGLGGDAEGDTLSEIENLTGSSFDDVLTGDILANRLDGGSGADTLNGGGGDDTLIGGGGADSMNGGVGHDIVNGGSGADILYGENGNDTLNGGADNDQLFGGIGADFLIGGAGADTLNGGDGHDTLDGGAGNDILTGGTGNDLFLFVAVTGADTITDFQAGAGLNDVIRLDGAVFTDFADIMAHTSDDGLGNTVISKSGLTITLTGVLKAQLVADDFDITAAGSPARVEEALTIPGLAEDDPLILPSTWTAPHDEEALTVPPLADELDPLVLPVGLESKLVTTDDAPVICPPGLDGVPGAPDIDPLEAALADFATGRSPHRLLAEPHGLDWII